MSEDVSRQSCCLSEGATAVLSPDVFACCGVRPYLVLRWPCCNHRLELGTDKQTVLTYTCTGRVVPGMSRNLQDVQHDLKFAFLPDCRHCVFALPS